MRRYPIAVLAAAAALTACGSANEEPADSAAPETPHTAEAEPPRLPAESPAAGAVRVSPDGVTTVVDVPSVATENQYGQACLAAKRWFDEHREPVETYLKTLQADGAVGPGTFDATWVDLTQAQQAGVIMAANAAERGECG
ncbi:lipoprotein LpqV [Mycobacterium sp. C31M]